MIAPTPDNPIPLPTLPNQEAAIARLAELLGDRLATVAHRIVPIDALAQQLATYIRADQERLLDVQALAERLDLSPRGVRGLVARRELPEGHLIGGARRWSWSTVLKWLESRAERKPRRKRRGQYDRGGDA